MTLFSIRSHIYTEFTTIWSSTDIGLMFYVGISKALLDYVLCYCDTIALKTQKSREKNEGGRYFDYCGITTTEYKWTTHHFHQGLFVPTL